MYMENLTNKEPDIKDITVQDSTHKEPEPWTACSAIGARERIITDFLGRSAP